MKVYSKQRQGTGRTASATSRFAGGGRFYSKQPVTNKVDAGRDRVGGG